MLLNDYSIDKSCENRDKSILSEHMINKVKSKEYLLTKTFGKLRKKNLLKKGQTTYYFKKRNNAMLTQNRKDKLDNNNQQYIRNQFSCYNKYDTLSPIRKYIENKNFNFYINSNVNKANDSFSNKSIEYNITIDKENKFQIECFEDNKNKYIKKIFYFLKMAQG